MNFTKFSQIVSRPRMQSYLDAVYGNQIKALQLYQLNLQLSKDFLAILSMFELALRNKIDNVISGYASHRDWLSNCIKKDINCILPNNHTLSATLIFNPTQSSNTNGKNEFSILRIEEKDVNGRIISNRFRNIVLMEIKRTRTITSVAKKELEISIELELVNGQRVYHTYTEIVDLNKISFLEKDGNQHCLNTAKIISKEHHRLRNSATHNKLIAELTFGFWHFLFNKPQFNATEKILLQVFPHHHFPSTMSVDDKRKDLSALIAKILDFRNRVAHHEPLCLEKIGHSTHINIAKAKGIYEDIKRLINYMGISHTDLFPYTTESILETLSLISNFNQASKKRIIKKKITKKVIPRKKLR